MFNINVGKYADSILELIGNTPMVKLRKLTDSDSGDILAKLESFNPGGSVKDRICLSMIKEAQNSGLIKPGSTIIEPTSGNTGIGLAMVSAVYGYRCVLTMPELMAEERIYILKSFGAEIVLTPAIEGMMGAIKKAEELHNETPNSFMPHQFINKNNPKIHTQTTAKEIIKQVGGVIDAFVAGVGTGGTLTGVGVALKDENPNLKIIAVEPKTNAVLSGKKPGPHKIQGIGAGFVPEILDLNIIDKIIVVDDNDAFKTSKALVRQEAIFAGLSSGAATWAAIEIAKNLGKGKKVVVVLPDTGERYFSMEQYFKT